jgi:gliding motility-associated-like protein
MRTVLFALFCLMACALQAQPCTEPGQTPSTAFPVCGTRLFTQVSVPVCGGRRLPSPHCSDELTDKNPYFYKFTCFQSGGLGFVITPKTLQEDYDWELYDITGMDPNAIYTNGSLVVGCNWTAEFGLTGASSAGTNLFECAGPGVPLFSKMPQLIAGHNYLLLVSHFSDSQSGYTLEFKGGNAVITDTAIPHLKKAVPNCSGDVLRVNISKKIKCGSIAPDGSDFFITPAAGNTTATTGFECATKFDTDSLELKLDRFLPPGNYKLNIKAGSDGNTMLDYCDNAVPISDVLDFTVTAGAPTPMDSLTKPACAPNTLQLVFRKPVLCSSIAANGSDFIVTGSYPVTVTGAWGNCGTNGLTSAITVTLSQPMVRAGSFNIQLQRGSDGNALLDECAVETPAGSFIPFQVKDTVNADFTYSIQYNCAVDVVGFFHPGTNVTSWLWDLDDGIRSNLQAPQAQYTVFEKKDIRLIVSNGFCSDTSSGSLVLENFLKADFTMLEDNCPLDPVAFTAKPTGKVTQHDWSFGDGAFGSGATTTHVYQRPVRETTYNVRYTVTDSFGCQKTIQKPVKIYISCIVEVPNAFTPNGDRINDYLYPMNAVKADQLEFTVYNRWGQMVFRTSNWKQGWDGRLNGQLQASDTYVWLLRYINRDTGLKLEKKGFAILIR